MPIFYRKLRETEIANLMNLQKIFIFSVSSDSEKRKRNRSGQNDSGGPFGPDGASREGVLIFI